MTKKNVLFICVHNSGRSQMAQAYANALGGGEIVADSAGFEPTVVNELVIESMRLDGLDISASKPKSVFDLFKAGRMFDYVVTVCDDSREGQCPVFPGVTRRLHVPFDDPADADGSREEQLERVGRIRDAIKARVASLIAEWKSDQTAEK